MSQHPELTLQIAEALSRRLSETDRELSAARDYVQSLAVGALPLLPPDEREASCERRRYAKSTRPSFGWRSTARA